MEIDRNRLRLDLENYFGTAQILMSSRQITIFLNNYLTMPLQVSLQL